MVERVKTGIGGLDELIEGGLPGGSCVLVSGSPGTGKTIFGLQFLVTGAMNDEPGIYTTFEESREDLINQAQGFNWDLEKLEEENRIKINSVDPKDLKQTLEKIEKEKEEINAKRLVIDSLSTIGIYATSFVSPESIEIEAIMDEKVEITRPIIGEAFTRRAVHYVIKRIKGLGLTTIMTSELAKESDYLSRDTVSEFACDGVIKLVVMEGMGKRTLTIEKLRSTKHEIIPVNMEIADNGIVVKLE